MEVADAIQLLGTREASPPVRRWDLVLLERCCLRGLWLLFLAVRFSCRRWSGTPDPIVGTETSGPECGRWGFAFPGRWLQSAPLFMLASQSWPRKRKPRTPRTPGASLLSTPVITSGLGRRPASYRARAHLAAVNLFSDRRCKEVTALVG
jgi:hypothetical protein